MRTILSAALAILAVSALATAETQNNNPLDVTKLAAPGTVSRSNGLDAWERIFAVASHPRCVNCHVGPDNIPVWSGPSYGKRRPHGMAINAGESRIAADGLACSACHQTSHHSNDVPHAAPRIAVPWQLAPTEFQWIDRSSVEICAQLRDPKRNGGRNADGLVQHILEDAKHGGFISWGFKPGGGREPAPGGLQEHSIDMALWTSAGMPCPME